VKSQTEKIRNCIQGINIDSLLPSHMLTCTFRGQVIYLFPDLITNSEVRRTICVGSIVIWFSERYKLSSRVNEEIVVEEIEVIEFQWDTNKQDLEEVVMETDSICYC
jgi:hypothetical protein